jgi:hypothetical protein
MVEFVGYCVKLKKKTKAINAVEVVMKNGRRALKGVCSEDGTVMFKILGMQKPSSK